MDIIYFFNLISILLKEEKQRSTDLLLRIEILSGLYKLIDLPERCIFPSFFFSLS